MIGSLIGDAVGGPIEFLTEDRLPAELPSVRRWPSGKKLDRVEKQKIANSLTMWSYEELRPDPAAFGPWKTKASAGTITDDSRHKVILMRALRRSLSDFKERPEPFTRVTLAREYLNPLEQLSGDLSEARSLDREGFAPYRSAAAWWCRTENASQPFPPERLWAGVPNCSGQMALLPLSGAFPGNPLGAYQATFAVDFMDSQHSVDFVAAINSGIAEIISTKHDQSTPTQRMETLFDTMRSVDPYRYSEIPFTSRPMTQWMDRAIDWARQADGEPKSLFHRLETEGRPIRWWDDHFTFVVPLSVLHLCPDNPLAAMQLVLDFGHDTDSYAQLLGAWIGAIFGESIFPPEMRERVTQQLRVDFDESVDQWCQTLVESASMVQTEGFRFERGQRAQR